ncbi:MAG: DNA topoisomerase [Clostridia bacterium]|nr:DNA topoisomerase [Clostridia bacterium]
MAKAKQTAYNDQSITKLKGAERVRLRPAVIFGSDGLEGCQHSFFEILANAVDEARAGYGSEITVTAYRDLSIRVEDCGRGVPLGYNEKEGCYNWELIYCELYAGGKYQNNSDDSAYDYALGLNGLGACATQYSSEFMQVQSFKEGKVLEIDFKGGEVNGELRERAQVKGDRRTGTTVYWRPDIKVFNDIRIPPEFFVATMRRQAIVNAGVRFVLRLEKEEGGFEESAYFYQNGIMDYISELTGEETMTAPVYWKMETMGRDRADKPDYKLRAEIAFCTSKTVSMAEYYHNSSYLELGGSPDKAVRAAFTFAIDKYLRSAGKYTKNEAKISYQDIEDCLVIIINSASTETSYENQTKKAINNVFITRALTDYIKQQLEVYFAENPAAADAIGQQVLLNKRSRETAESNRLQLKKKLTSSMDVTNRVEKFVSCRSKDPDERELYIVEGDSAMGACKQGRNAEFQAIIPVRGKTLNCMKSSYQRIFESKIIVDLLRVIGCGVELHEKVKSDLPPFDYNAFRWSKIIICTDADEDGFQIRTLLLTLFYRLLPTLLAKEKVFIAESPLFEITAKDKTYFAYNEAEKAKILADLGNTKYTLQRSKGLGENEPDMMWQTTMNPATRRLIAVTPADEAETLRMFDVLMGDALPERKKFIAENGHRYLADADI